jgi:DNA-binding transcriptional ArsR family regulator
MSRSRASAAKLARAAPVFAALGDGTRLNIVSRLCTGGPQPIVRLTEGAKVSRQAITKHLHALADAGLVRSTREGRAQIWELQPKRLAEARRYLGQISDQWDEAIDRLRTMVEQEKS